MNDSTFTRIATRRRACAPSAPVDQVGRSEAFWQTPGPVAVRIELLWEPESDGRQLIRTFRGSFANPIEAILTGCCLWSSADTGRGAVAAVVIGPSSVRCQIAEMASTCGQLDRARIAAVKATAQDAIRLAPATFRGRSLTFADLHHTPTVVASQRLVRLGVS